MGLGIELKKGLINMEEEITYLINNKEVSQEEFNNKFSKKVRKHYRSLMTPAEIKAKEEEGKIPYLDIILNMRPGSKKTIGSTTFQIKGRY